MGTKDSLELVAQLHQAERDGDWDRYGELLTDDVMIRMAGVPTVMGGVTKGREAAVEQMRANTAAGTFDVKGMFGDDDQVCVVGKMSAERFPGSEFLRGVDRPYSTYECVVYRIADGRVAEWTAYVNWLDPYVQMGLVDPTTLTP